MRVKPHEARTTLRNAASWGQTADHSRVAVAGEHDRQCTGGPALGSQVGNPPLQREPALQLSREHVVDTHIMNAQGRVVRLEGAGQCQIQQPARTRAHTRGSLARVVRCNDQVDVRDVG